MSFCSPSFIQCAESSFHINFIRNNICCTICNHSPLWSVNSAARDPRGRPVLTTLNIPSCEVSTKRGQGQIDKPMCSSRSRSPAVPHESSAPTRPTINSHAGPKADLDLGSMHPPAQCVYQGTELRSGATLTRSTSPSIQHQADHALAKLLRILPPTAMILNSSGDQEPPLNLGQDS